MAQEAAGPDVAGALEVTISPGKSQVLELPETYTDVMIGDPKIADVLPLNARSVYIVGKTMGSTGLTIYGPNKRLIAAVNVVVAVDIQGLKARLAEILPNEKDIAVRAANQSIVVSGTVSSPIALEQVMALAQSYAVDKDKVVNMLGVEGTQQVMLSVRFVEMERSTAKDLSLNVQRPAAGVTGANPAVQINTGDTVNNNASLLGSTFGNIMARFGSGSGSLDVLFDALEQKGLIKTLAEPTLVTMSGDTANFLAGGEFPVPVAQQASVSGGTPTISVDFKQFGIALAFTPTILQRRPDQPGGQSGSFQHRSHHLGHHRWNSDPRTKGPARPHDRGAARRRVLHYRRTVVGQLPEPGAPASFRRRHAGPGRSVPVQRFQEGRDRTRHRRHAAPGDAASWLCGHSGRSLRAAV